MDGAVPAFSATAPVLAGHVGTSEVAPHPPPSFFVSMFVVRFALAFTENSWMPTSWIAKDDPGIFDFSRI